MSFFFYILLATSHAGLVFPLPPLDTTVYYPHVLPSVTGRDNTISALRLKQTLITKSLQYLGVSFTPPEFQFGVTELGIQTCIQATMRNELIRKIIIEGVHCTVKDVTIKEDGSRVLGPKGQMILELCLTPRDLGHVEGRLMLKNNHGVAGVLVLAEVEESRYKLWPKNLRRGDKAAVLMVNPYPHTLTILDISSAQASLELLLSPVLSIPSGHNHTVCTFTVAANVTDPSQTLHILTSEGAMALPVLIHTEFSLSVDLEAIDFGIVSLLDMSHSVRLNISVSRPFVDLQVTSDSAVVRTSLFNTTIYLIDHLDAVFSPTEDGIYAGNITLVAENSEVLVIPYIGIALFGLMRYRMQDLIFPPEPFVERDLWLGLNFPYPVILFALTSHCLTFKITPIRIFNPLSAGDDGILMSISMNSSLPKSGPPFLSLECSLGVIALPLIVDEGSFTCQVNAEDCKVVTKLDLGSVQFGEARQIVVNITNTGFFPLHVSIGTKEMRHFVSAFALQAGNRMYLTDLLGNPCRFQVLEPSSVLLIHLDLVFTGSSPESLVSIHISHHTRELLLVWTPSSGDLIVTPKEIHLENVYMGRIQTVSILLQHSFPSTQHILKVSSNVDLIAFTKHQDHVVPNAPIHVRDVTYPVLRPGSVPLLLVQDYSEPVSPVEVRLWLSALLLSEQQVKGKITFGLQGVMDVVIPFSASFAPPKLVLKEVDFGFVHRNLLCAQYIRIHNPSDTSVRIQLLLYSGPLTTDPNITALVTAETAGLALSQHFYLSEGIKAPLDLPAHGTVVLGPLLCKLPQSALANSVLYLRNNLTGFESVPLSAKGAYGELTVVMEMDRDSNSLSKQVNSKRIAFDLVGAVPLMEQGKRLYGFTRSFLLRNTGNKPLFILNTVLEGGFCALHGFFLLSCHEVMYVLPGWLLEVTISVKPTFVSAVSSLDLVLITEEENLRVSIDILSPQTALKEVHLARHAFVPIWVLSGLLAVSGGALLAFFHEELKDKGAEMHPVAAKPTCEFQLTLLPLANPLPKRHKRKATPTLTSPQLRVITLERISQAPTFTQPVQMPPEPLEEETADMNDEDFLDDYKARSGLFWGFRQSAED